MELFQNCIKLASENKINQKNTWELNLIDHLCDIIKVEEENDVETNFQKASCTLEAGVRIYSMRVDSVHSEAYKVLGGISRVALDAEQDIEDGNTESMPGECTSNKEKELKLSPLSTLESSFEALNVKKFDGRDIIFFVFNLGITERELKPTYQRQHLNCVMYLGNLMTKKLQSMMLFRIILGTIQKDPQGKRKVMKPI